MDIFVEFMEGLVEEMEDTQWQIVEVTSYKVIEKDEVIHYAELPNGTLYEGQDNIFIKETKECEDGYFGTIIYPITSKKALKIHYRC